MTMAAEAYARLEEMIILGKLTPDVRLSEQMLAQILGLGRTPIREALQKLRENHLVDILPRSGVFVTRVDFRSQLLVMEVRRELERLVARRAARRASEAERHRFLQLAEAMREVGENRDKLGLMKVDRQFKELSLAAAANKFLSAALAPIHAHSRRFYFTHLETTNVPIALSHAEAIEAIGRGDEALAVAATEGFLEAMEAFTKAVITAELADV
ncbi:GntR family transcriptional regulator [Phreatobacter sp. AB_2022a]|uniref:GntR family transcriptional regulator n=1 Tax=Phreatobacter sp. AB_2022a TaxID=3003134 RepID=UPI002286D169|nr:GntR family transcriptional regulator [Phreatobacter sp. AB_2022a]MCZ0738033.1 GntR family transcriptional regulator [Phreatobacter sp. AB_2022a]